MQSIQIPITNVYAKGGYTACVFVGEQQTPVNLILDTGSSVLAIHNKNYQPELDGNLKASTWVQDIQYGAGGWYGPVVTTRLSIGVDAARITIDDVPVALTVVQIENTFFEADGIWGLAYSVLDHAFDLTDFLKAEKVEPCFSFPYLLGHHADDVSHYSHFLHQYPKLNIEPYFDCIEKSGVVANQFGLLTHRSSVYHTDKHTSTEVADTLPLNHGLLVLGSPLTLEDLYQKPVHSVKVLHDKYYNVNVLSVQVGDMAKIPVPQLAAKDVRAYCTNGIVDSGASVMVLPAALLQEIKSALASHHVSFAELLAPYNVFSQQEVATPLSALDLKLWPEITLFMEGENTETVALTLTPDTYWQVNAPQKGQATFKMCSLPGWPNQLILGLPLLNNYFTIFDRSAEDGGVIHFAKKSSAPKWGTNTVIPATNEQ